VTLLATKVAGLEAELQSSIERAELAEERAANLEVGRMLQLDRLETQICQS
jgi:hypothetical protein